MFIRILEKIQWLPWTPLSTFSEWFWIYSGVFTSHPQHSPAPHCTWTGHETRTRFSGFAWSSWRCWPLQHVWRPGVSDSVCWADLQNLRKNLVPTLGFICAFYSEISKCSWWLFKVESITLHSPVSNAGPPWSAAATTHVDTRVAQGLQNNTAKDQNTIWS